MVATEPHPAQPNYSHRAQPNYSTMATVNPYFQLRSEIMRVTNWLEKMRDVKYGKMTPYWDLRSAYLLSKHRQLLTRLEYYYTNTESNKRSSVLPFIRNEYKRLWKSVPDSPTCPSARTERERTVLAFGYDPAQAWKTLTSSKPF